MYADFVQAHMGYVSVLSRVAAVWLLVHVALSCSAYDADLLEPASTLRAELVGECGDGRVGRDELCDVAIEAGEPGACPLHCDDGQACIPEIMVGAGCNRRCVFTFITSAKGGDGCCPPGASAEDDPDCGFCGDSLIGPDETCDPAESCPARQDCVADDPCIVAQFSGDPELCTARCEYSAISVCVDGDACCADGCSGENDGDCSLQCGNGTVDSAAGETCEQADPDSPCDIDCEDGDPCTQDLQTGAADNCNVACSHISVTERHAGDRCCPSGASWRDDHDCPPICGNDRVEADEACDGSDDCTADCSLKRENTSIEDEQGHCLGFQDTEASDDCKRCVCDRCTSQALDCYDSGDSERDARCAQLSECGNRNGCYDFSCYCGGGACLPAEGPCRRETEEAVGATDLVSVLRCYSDPNCATYRARQLGECLATQCASSCNEQY
jgi:hypothetical protein